MEGPGPKTIACALVVIVVASRVAGEYDGRDSEMMEGPRVERMHPETSDSCSGGNCLQNSEGPVGAMWFGPRLGRRRRSDPKLNGKKIEALSEMLARPNWGLESMPDASMRTASTGSTGSDDKRQEAPFTPRLGRELEDSQSTYDLLRALLSLVAEETSDKERDQQQQQQQQQQVPQRMLPPPRLGRGNPPPSPKLERELRNLLRKLQLQ